MPAVPIGEMWEDGGVPTYQLFRSYAVFVPDLADFALTHKQCNKLMAECGIDLLCGTGMGDSHILYNSVAKKGFLLYDSLCHIFRVLGSRKLALQSRVASEAEAAANRRDFSSSTSLTRDTSHSRASAGPASTAVPAAAATASMYGGQETARKGNPYAATASGKGIQPGLGTFSTTPDIAAFGASSLLGRTPRTMIGQPLNAHTSSSAALKGFDQDGQMDENSPSQPLWGMGAVVASQDPPSMLREIIPPTECPFKKVKAKFKFVKELMSTGQPKVAFGALKELPGEWGQAVEEKQAAIAAKKAGKKGAKPEGEGEAAPPCPPPPTSPGKGAALFLHLVPVEGLLYIYLLTASYALTHDDLVLARQQLNLAELTYDVEKMGTDHHYYYLIYMCQGLLSFYEGDYETSYERLEIARNLADLKDRDLREPVARKNHAHCHNNIGVCELMLSQTSRAAASFQTAVDMLTLLGPGPLVLKNQALDVARSNLRRAVKYSFASGPSSTARPATALGDGLGSSSRPATAPAGRPMTAGPRLTAGGGPPLSFSASGSAGGLRPTGTRLTSARGAPSLSSSVCLSGSADERLQKFLRQTITLRTPAAPTALPAWAVRAVPSEKDAKKKDAKGKGKDAKGKKGKGEKKKKPKGFQITYDMPVYSPPQYSIANIPAEKKKKKVKKGDVAAAAAAAAGVVAGPGAPALDPLALLPPSGSPTPA